MNDLIKILVENEDLLTKAILRFGINNQKDKTIEELLELAIELKKDINKRPSHTEEEFADVFIMLAQMILVYNQYEIRNFIEFKLERLKTRYEL